MKTSERHRLKDNDLALAITSAQGWYVEHQQTLLAGVAAVVIVAGAGGGDWFWKGRADTQGRSMLAAAMVIDEARVMPPGPPAGTTLDPTLTPGQAPGTYPTEKTKREAALPKFMAAADAYPASESGLMARYYAANTLVALGRVDEAIAQYDQVIVSGTSVVARMSKLGKAEAQLIAKQFDPAIGAIKEMAEAKDPTALPPDALLMELARAYRLAGKGDEAKKTLTEITEKHADSPFAAEAKAELEKLKN